MTVDYSYHVDLDDDDDPTIIDIERTNSIAALSLQELHRSEALHAMTTDSSILTFAEAMVRIGAPDPRQTVTPLPTRVQLVAKSNRKLVVLGAAVFAIDVLVAVALIVWG